MKIAQKINPAVIQAATVMLAQYVPEISPASLVAALKEYQNTNSPTERKRPYTRKEVCDLLGISLQTINRMMNRGELRRMKIGMRAVRIDPASVDALLEAAQTA